jgi:HEAT repeat protein
VLPAVLVFACGASDPDQAGPYDAPDASSDHLYYPLDERWVNGVRKLQRIVRDSGELDRLVATARARLGSDPTGALLALLDDPSADNRRFAALTLGALGAEASSAMPTLVRALHDHRGIERSAAIALLEQGSTAAPALVDALAEDAAGLRGMAAELLLQLSTDALPVLIDRLTDSDPVIRVEVAALLAQTRAMARPATAALTAALSDPEVGVRVWSVTALGVGAECGSLPSLTLALADPEPEVRGAAVRAIAAFGGEARDTLGALSALQDDPDSDVARATRETIARIAR